MPDPAGAHSRIVRRHPSVVVGPLIVSTALVLSGAACTATDVGQGPGVSGESLSRSLPAIESDYFHISVEDDDDEDTRAGAPYYRPSIVEGLGRETVDSTSTLGFTNIVGEPETTRLRFEFSVPCGRCT